MPNRVQSNHLVQSVSNQTANKEIRYLRSLFNWGIKKQYVFDNPANRVEMLRVEKRNVYVPSIEDIDKVFAIANVEQHDYLCCLRDTFARSKEINKLTWQDIDFDKKTITLHTRKKRHGTKTPRIVPLTERLFLLLQARQKHRSPDTDYVFWHEYYSKKLGKHVIGCYNDRKKFMRSLCRKANVKYFRFHPLRHAGASFMESIGIPISHIQKILGHENRSTTEGYIHSLNGSTSRAFTIYQEQLQKLGKNEKKR